MTGHQRITREKDQDDTRNRRKMIRTIYTESLHLKLAFTGECARCISERAAERLRDSRLDKCTACGIKRVTAVSKRGLDSGYFLQTLEESELRVKAGCAGCSVMRIEI